jgi:hypothetical protein
MMMQMIVMKSMIWIILERDELEEAVQHDIAPDIQEVCIDNVEITKESMSKLAAIFTATNSCAYARFDNVNLCEVGIVSLSKLVDASSKLTNCFIRHNRMHNMESVCCLSRSLKSHTCINQLHLTHCELGGNPEILLVILQSDVECITLSNNNIDSLGAVKIAEYLKGDPAIKYLSLDYNRLMMMLYSSRKR